MWHASRYTQVEINLISVQVCLDLNCSVYCPNPCFKKIEPNLNGYFAGMTTVTQTQRPQNIDIKLLHAKKQQAEMRRNQKEEDLRENHPYFDRPLFAVPRESTFRRVCQAIVNASYDARLKVSVAPFTANGNG